MEILTNKKGSKKVVHQGYTFTKKKTTKSTTRWECSKRQSLSCKGALVSDLDVIRVISVTDHNHEADQFEVEALKLRYEIMDAADANRGKSGQILADKLVNYPVEVRVAAGKKDTLKRAIRRVKRGTAPPELLTYRVHYQSSIQRLHKILVYDNELPTSRLLVFASESGLNILDSADTWFMDGTHSTAPGQFAQLFCVRVPLGVTHITAAYGLLPGKQHQHYEEFFTGLLDACLQRNVRPTPIEIGVDYQMAIHNAIRSVINPNIHIQGCFYHLTQSTWRHIQAEGLQARYQEDDNIRHFCGMLDGLAFLPVPMVSDGMAYIRETAREEMVPIIDYFDSNYVSGAYRAVMGNGRMRFRRTPPRFELQMWNVHDATITDCARTNNICESWNNGFRHLVGHSNPSLIRVRLFSNYENNTRTG